MAGKLVATVAALGVATVLAACSGGGSAATEPASPTQGSPSPTSEQAVSPTESASATPTEQSASATPDATESAAPAVEMPPGPEAGTPAAVAWEALMGPEGEYAASASYAAVIDTFGEVQPYVDIRSGEERHISALVRQLNRLGVEPPPNPYLGKLTAPDNLEAAAAAWAKGEVLNVEMYDVLLTQTTDQSLLRVLENLRRASQDSHLPLFEAAAANGGTLTPEQMSQVQTAG